MGHRQQMTDKQRLEWDINSYKKKLEANKGHNYEYWSETKHGKMLENGWDIHRFEVKRSTQDSTCTASEEAAKEAVTKLREEGNYARIVCGYEKNVQRTKMFTVIFKKK